MKKRINIIVLVFLLLSGFIPYNVYSQVVVSDAKLRTGKLENGLTYYIRQNDKVKGLADFYLAQKVGSILEEDNQRGLAHFLEHMAFNGTKNFPGNELISGLEKKGIKFGININASTGYDQTIYKLTDISLNTKGIIDTALLILHDWSGFISNNDQDIEDERGVVRQEWRTRSTANTRVLENGVFPIIYKGSAYANRIPIGSIEIINNFKPQQLKDYYLKWYRPDLQAVIVIGDIDVEKMEQKIKSLFSDIPMPVNPAKRVEFEIQDNKEPIVAIATEPELSDIGLDIYWKLRNYPRSEKASLNYYRTKMIHKMIVSLLVNRFYKVRENHKHLYANINAKIEKFLIADSKTALALNIYHANKDSIAGAFSVALTEMERIKRFGFSSIDLDNAKEDAMSLLERGYAGRYKKENTEYVNSCISNFVDNEPIVDEDWNYDTGKSIIAGLSLDSLNNVTRSLIGDTNIVFVITGPRKQEAELPLKEEIIEVWKNIKRADLTPYVSTRSKKNKELPKINPKGGKVLKTEQKPFGFVQWTLSNGAKVQFKKTEDKDGDLFIWANSSGGLSVIKEEDLPSALAMNKIINEGGLLDPERRAALTFKMDSYNETLGGKTSNLKNIEGFFHLLFLKMTTLEKQQKVFDSYLESKQTENSKLSLNPKDAYVDTLTSIMKNHNSRALISLSDPKTLKKVDYDKIIRIYKERFGNAAGFTFFITGNVSLDTIKLFVEKYIGGLPSLNKKEAMKDHRMYPPKGVVKKHFKAPMKTPQSTITIGYTGKAPVSLENEIMWESLKGILKIDYREKMREKEGGTYGVSVSADLNRFPVESFIFQLNFDADPTKKKKLMEIAYQEIEDIKKYGPDKEKLEKVKQNLLSIYRQKSGEKNAYYWMNNAWMLEVYGVDGRLDYETLVSSVTPKKLQDFAKKIFDQGNIIEVSMDPIN